MVRDLTVPLVLLALLLAPAAAASHQAPIDWTKNNPNDKQFLSVFDRQAMVTTESNSETGGPFLSINKEDAGSVQHVSLADAASGPAAMASSIASGSLSQTWRIDLPSGLPEDMWINMSRPIYGRLFWTQTTYRTVPTAAKSADMGVLRVELLSGERRLGGYEDAVNLAVPFGTWSWISVNLWPEMAVVKQGEPLSLRISRSGGTTDFLLGTGGDHQTYFDVRYTTIDPLAGGLYLENRKLVTSSDIDSPKDFLLAAPGLVRELERQNAEPGVYRADSTPASGPAYPLAALFGIPLFGLLAARKGPRPRTALLALCLVAAASLAGCAGARPGTTTHADPADSDGPQPTANVTYEERNEPTTVEGVGDIEGVVQDEVGLPIPEAHVSLLGTNNFNDTDRRGTFAFHGIAMGLYRLRVDARNFGSLEQDVEVRANTVARVTVMLARPNAGSPGASPHLHDDWGGQTKLVIYDGPVSLPQCANRDRTGAGNQNCRVQVPTKYEQPIPPGTGRVEVKLTWSAASPMELMLDVETGVQHFQWIQAGGSGFGVFNQFYVARKSGDAFNVVVFPNEADPGHQRFTNWRFWVSPSVADLLAPSRVSPYAATNVQVEIVAHKVVVPFEPAHRDFWQNKTELVIVNHAPKGPAAEAAATTAFPTFSYAWRLDQSPGLFIPPGTLEVRGYILAEGSAASLTTWGITFRHCEIPPNKGTADYPEATMQGTGNNRTFTLKPTPLQADQMYAKVSCWWFFVEDEDQPVNSAPRTTWRLGIVAVKDPAWIDS